MRPMRTLINKLRRKLGDAGARPTYIFTERRVGYRMPKGEGRGEEPTSTPWKPTGLESRLNLQRQRKGQREGS